MIIIQVKESESIEKSLKKLKKKFEKIGTLKQLRSRMHYKKKSVKRRQEILKAIYKQKLYVNENY